MIQSDKIIRRTRASMKAARDRALFFWSFLVFHPEVTHKAGVPSEVYGVLALDQSHCPLCSMFRRMQGDEETCAGCPLMKGGVKCFEAGGLFAR